MVCRYLFGLNHHSGGIGGKGDAACKGDKGVPVHKAVMGKLLPVIQSGGQGDRLSLVVIHQHHAKLSVVGAEHTVIVVVSAAFRFHGAAQLFHKTVAEEGNSGYNTDNTKNNTEGKLL